MFYIVQVLLLTTVSVTTGVLLKSPDVAVLALLARCPYASCINVDQCQTGLPAFKQKACPEQSSVTPCFCDKICILFGDCCYDFFPTCLGFKLTDQEKIVHERKRIYQIYQESINLQMLMKHSECLPSTNSSLLSEHYVMVSQCSRKESWDFNKDLVAKCHNQTLSDFGPVPVSLISLPYLTFKNIFCALCHGLERKDIQFWNASAVCPQSMDVNFKNKSNLRRLSELCFINAKPHTSSAPRPCNPFVKTVPPSGLYLEGDLCPYYQFVMADKNNSLYKNPHCAKVMPEPGVSYRSLRCAWNATSTPPKHGAWMETIRNHTPSKNTALGPSYGVGSLNILFQFSGRGVLFETDRHHHYTVERVEYCSVDQVYDFYIDRCKDLSCPHHKKPVNGSCVQRDLPVTGHAHDVKVENNTSYWITVNILSTEEMESSDGELKMEFSVVKGVKYCFQQIKNATVYNVTRNNYTECFLENSTDSFLEQFFESPNYTSQFVLNIQLPPLNIENIFNVIDCLYNVSAYSPDLSPIQQLAIVNTNPETCSLCKNGTVMRHTNISVTNSTPYLVHQSIHEIRENGVLGVFRIQRNATWIISCEDGLTDHNILHCSHGSLSYDPSEYIMTNKTVTLKESGKLYSPGKYVFKDAYVTVCNQEFISQYIINYTSIFFCYDDTQEVISMVTSSISMVSLILVLVVYWLLPSIRNNAGKIVMSLSGTMLLAQGLLVVLKLPRDIRVICVVTAVLAHWAWLSTFTWMTVLSVDLTRSIRAMLPSSNPHLHPRPFLRYALAAWLLPFLFVGVSLLVDLLNLPHLHVGYGGSTVCWIDNDGAVVALFGVPASIAIAINIVCFVLTFGAIESSSRTLSELKSRSRSNKRRLGVYVRLMFIMGFTWIFSFVAVFSGVQLLWYCQAVFNGVQGLYIFIAFVAKRRVVCLLRAAWNKRRQPESVTATVSN